MKFFIVTLTVIFFASIATHLYACDSLSHKLAMLKLYTESIEPAYIIDSDTFVVAKLTRPPDSINSFLFHCKEKDITEAYKYAFLPILKLCLEYGRFDYDFCDYYYETSFSDNGTVELALHAMGIEYDFIGCAFTKTRSVYLWLSRHKKIYKGYKLMEVYMQKVKKKLKEEEKQLKLLKKNEGSGSIGNN